MKSWEPACRFPACVTRFGSAAGEFHAQPEPLAPCRNGQGMQIPRPASSTRDPDRSYRLPTAEGNHSTLLHFPQCLAHRENDLFEPTPQLRTAQRPRLIQAAAGCIIVQQIE